MLITRRLEFDAGHRIPNHNSQCRHLHGHRYAIEITLSGQIIATEGVSEQGMVMDFTEVKSIAQEVVVNQWDHAFLAYRGDAEVVAFLATLPGHKTVVLDVVPTAENLAAVAFQLLDAAYI
ncbi:MAG: 6-carboxytetrahydropterin synthase QueD, partial [Sulfurimicrobium sp.]|nr:6-carboxytetrahydropterin synthase QueD [Sulfurimicrobium sp.]